MSTFQTRVVDWVRACLGAVEACDLLERQDRFLEEALELLQATGYDRDRVARLITYVYARPVGEARQEVGGTMTTLGALCAVLPGIDMMEAGEAELIRCCQRFDQIRAKHHIKPRGAALFNQEPTP